MFGFFIKRKEKNYVIGLQSLYCNLKKELNEKFYPRTIWLLFIIYLIFFSISIHAEVTDPDDLYFSKLFKNISILQVLGINARIVPNFVAGLLISKSLIIWKVFTPFLFVLLIYSIIKMIISTNEKNKQNISGIILFVTLTFAYIYPLVLTSSMFWIAGSFIYLWPVSIGCYSFLHFTLLSNNKEVKLWKMVLFLISAFYAAFSQEQISLILSVFSIIFIIYFSIIKHRPFNRYLMIQTFIYICGTLFLLLYPSSHSRFQSEIITWYPEFSNLTIWDKIFRGSIWLFDQLFNKEKFIIIIILALLFIYNLRYCILRRTKIIIGMILALPLSILLLSSLPVDTFIDKLGRGIQYFQGGIFRISFDSYLLDFISFNVKNYHFSSSFEYIRFFFWLFYLVCIPLVTFFIGKDRQFQLITFLIIVAGMLSSSLMFFSPTIYASGHRIFFPMDVLFVLFCGLLYNKAGINRNQRQSKFLFIYSVYPAILYITLLWIWRNGYSVLY